MSNNTDSLSVCSLAAHLNSPFSDVQVVSLQDHAKHQILDMAFDATLLKYSKSGWPNTRNARADAFMAKMETKYGNFLFNRMKGCEFIERMDEDRYYIVADVAGFTLTKTIDRVFSLLTQYNGERYKVFSQPKYIYNVVDRKDHKNKIF